MCFPDVCVDGITFLLSCSAVLLLSSCGCCCRFDGLLLCRVVLLIGCCKFNC